MPQVSYGSTVFPVMLGVFFMYFVYKFVKKIMPEVITFFMTPLVTMIIVVPVELIVLGPLGTELSNGVAAVCMFLSNTIGFLLQPLLARSVSLHGHVRHRQGHRPHVHRLHRRPGL